MASDDVLREFDLEHALQLYYERKIDLEGLCRLMASYGSRRSKGDQSGVEDIAHGLSLMVHDRATVASEQFAPPQPVEDDDPATQKLGKRTPREPGSDPMQTSPSGVSGAAKPKLLGPSQTRAARGTVSIGGGVPRVSTDDEGTEQTPLSRYCMERGILPRVTVGLDEDSPPLSAPGDVGYAVGPQLGVGGVGHVRLGVDRDMRRTVAIKTLRTEHLSDTVQLQAFIEEAIVTGGLEHPNIVAVYALGHSEELGPYYAMARIKGRPLSRVLRALRARDRDVVEHYGLFRLLEIFVEVSRGIAFAHDRGVIHCDLKPSNVVVGDYGEVTIVDWGLARVLGKAGRGQARALLNSGTPAYMPPEQASGNISDLDQQTDIWSLGAILYELLTLTVPFQADTSEETIIRLMADSVELPSERAPQRHIPQDLERICMRALQRDKLARYPNVPEMLRDIQAYVDGVKERRRRDEEARQALKRTRRLLNEAAETEAKVDELQDLVGRTVDARKSAYVRKDLDAERDDLVFLYTDAAKAVEQGIEAVPGHSRLLEALADLYWRIFRRLYPARVTPTEQVRDYGIQLLTRLSQLGIGAIVSEARKRGTATDQTSTAGQDPWLDAVLAFCGSDMEISEGSTPNAMAPLIQRISFLKNVSLFQQMSAADLLPIAEACHEVQVPDGAAIFAEGDFGDALYVVMGGAVAIEKSGNVINTLGTMTCFGEIAVLDQQPRTASAVARGDVRCLVLTAERFRRIVKDNGEIGLAVMKQLTHRIRVATNREASLRSGIAPTVS